jgi:hypothetical protein
MCAGIAPAGLKAKRLLFRAQPHILNPQEINTEPEPVANQQAQNIDPADRRGFLCQYSICSALLQVFWTVLTRPEWLQHCGRWNKDSPLWMAVPLLTSLEEKDIDAFKKFVNLFVESGAVSESSLEETPLKHWLPLIIQLLHTHSFTEGSTSKDNLFTVETAQTGLQDCACGVASGVASNGLGPSCQCPNTSEARTAQCIELNLKQMMEGNEKYSLEALFDKDPQKPQAVGEYLLIELDRTQISEVEFLSGDTASATRRFHTGSVTSPNVLKRWNSEWNLMATMECKGLKGSERFSATVCRDDETWWLFEGDKDPVKARTPVESKTSCMMLYARQQKPIAGVELHGTPSARGQVLGTKTLEGSSSFSRVSNTCCVCFSVCTAGIRRERQA